MGLSVQKLPHERADTLEYGVPLVPNAFEKTTQP